MVRYLFDHWEDGSTNPTRTITLTADKVITAYYVSEVITRRLTFQSSPIVVSAQVDGTPVPSGSYVELPDGTTVTVTVPQSVEV